MCELLNEANVPYDLRQDVSFRSYNVKTLLYGTEMLSYLGPKIWNWVVSDIRDCAKEKKFSKRLKNGNQIDVHEGYAKYSLFRLTSLIYAEKFKFENPAIKEDKNINKRSHFQQ